jgi:hypothetical protein
MATPREQEILSALTTAFEAGHRAIVVMIAKDDVAKTMSLKMRSTPVSVGMLHATAMVLVDRAVVQAGHITDGSAGAALPHLRDALRSLQAAEQARSEPVEPVIGRA